MQFSSFILAQLMAPQNVLVLSAISWPALYNHINTYYT